MPKALENRDYPPSDAEDHKAAAKEAARLMKRFKSEEKTAHGPPQQRGETPII
jgi:hypothetical protein